jgi:hypothetical protein
VQAAGMTIHGATGFSPRNAFLLEGSSTWRIRGSMWRWYISLGIGSIAALIAQAPCSEGD